jgi:DNA-binding MarR family transcriptional regulator
MVTTSANTGAIMLITRLARIVYRHSTEELLGLRLQLLTVLNYLHDQERAKHGPTTQQGLTEGLCVEQNYCVLLLNELEADGLVRRRRDPADRRRHIVELTDEGRQAVTRAEAGQASIEGGLLANLTPGERDTLTKLLHKALD